jgi:mono/diheme cytochrome c family protein
MRKFFKILMWFGLAIVVVIVFVVVYIQLSWNKSFEAPYPDIKSSADPVMIERGRYLAYGPSHCASCHAPMDKAMAIEEGQVFPLSGGWEESIAGLGTFRAPNLTPDPETGIGNMTDAQLARAIRYGVKHDGTFLPPFMLFQGMSDEDISSVISFLRSQEPVKNKVAPTEYSFLAKALITFGMLKPEGPSHTPPKSVQRDSTVQYGQYIADNLGNCRGCHIAMNSKGQRIGADFSGGGIFPPNAFSDGYGFVSPNLTPHVGTGVMAEWDEAFFIDRFRGGRLHKGSPMPWGLFSKMDETDLKALYRYLHSLEPVENRIVKTVYSPGEKMPEPAR